MNRKSIPIVIAVIGLLRTLTLTASAQNQFPISTAEPASRRNSDFGSLPTERNLRLDSELDVAVPLRSPEAIPVRPDDFKKLMSPRFQLSTEWEPDEDGISISSYDLSMQMPLYPIFGPPPPFINASYSLTQFDMPVAIDLPHSVHEFSLGLAWIRRINEQWTTRFTLNGAFASDLDNNSSDAWQARAGGFAIYRPNEEWSFAFGALVTGRDDIPVIPAIGAIWEPTPELSVNLMLPNPKIAVLLASSSTRQHWGYFGGGFSGGTWAYERVGDTRERLTYREWKLVLGWESRRPRPRGTFRQSGTTLHAEIGYVFGRKFEFDSGAPSIRLDGSPFLRVGISF